MRIIIKMVIMVEMVIMVNMVILVEVIIMVEIFIMVEDGRDGQNWHLNLTFQVTCEGQLSQFLQCLIQQYFCCTNANLFFAFFYK